MHLENRGRAKLAAGEGVSTSPRSSAANDVTARCFHPVTWRDVITIVLVTAGRAARKKRVKSRSGVSAEPPCYCLETVDLIATQIIGSPFQVYPVIIILCVAHVECRLAHMCLMLFIYLFSAVSLSLLFMSFQMFPFFSPARG